MTSAIKNYIKDQLSSYSYYKYWPVIEYGSNEDTPSTPYIVVRDMGPQAGMGTGYLVVVHESPGNNSSCDKMIALITSILHKKILEDSYKNNQQLFATDIKSGIIVDIDDGTISKDRMFMSYKPKFL